MANYAVRRLGLAPCTEATYNNLVKREALVRKGDKDALKKFDEALAKKVEKAGTAAKPGTNENKTDGGNNQ